jgi:hypothetical protein
MAGDNAAQQAAQEGTRSITYIPIRMYAQHSSQIVAISRISVNMHIHR